MADSQDTEMAVSLVEAVYAQSLTKDVHPDDQNSLKDQLLLQALPPYVPPAAPSEHYGPEQLFSCKDCDDKFLLESSLLRHIQRRSVTISYGCCKCARTVSFYNRCAFLAHLRGHSIESNDDATTENIGISQEKMNRGLHEDDNSEKNDDVEMEPDAVSLSPLPKDKMHLGPFIPMPLDDCGRLIREGGDQKPKPPESVKTENNKVASHENESKEVTSRDDNQSSESKDNEHQSQLVNDKAPPVISTSGHSGLATSGGEKSLSSKQKYDNQGCDDELQKVPDESRSDNSTPDSELSGSLECNECGKVPQTKYMKDHFLCSNLPYDLQLKCDKCNLILPSSCSFSAHKRIHSQTKPYICPECSREFELWASLSVHMIYSCFHMSKSVRYRCVQCKCLFPTAVSLEVHLLTQHVRPVYKCNACPIACFSVETLEDHKVSTHGLETVATHSYQLCRLCPDQIIPKSRLLPHVNKHSKDRSVRIYVHQCSKCSFFAQKKTDFAVHWATCSRSQKAKVGIVPPALNPETVLAAHKVLIPPECKQGNNVVKVIYTVSQNKMQLAVLPKSSVKTVKRIMLPQSKFRKLLPKTDGTPQDKTKSVTALNKSMPVGSEGTRKDVSDQGQGKYVYVSERKCEANAEEAEAALCAMASDSRVVENVPASSDDADGTRPDNASFTVNSMNILRLCSSCRKELIVSSPGAARFPAYCENCAKEHALLKKDGKLLLLPTSKIVNSENNINGTLESTTKIEDGKKIVSANKNSDLKRTSNSIALNGPMNVKKLKTSPGVSLENNKYRCHLCKMLISMDWFKVQEHFASNHPNFKLLVLSPKVSKLKMNSTSVRVPFVIKDHRIYPKIMCVKKGVTETNTAKNEVNEVYVRDLLNEDCERNENFRKKEFDGTDNEKGSSQENGGFSESAYFLKKERDIPIDYDLVPSKIKRKKKSSQKASDKAGAVTPFSSGQIVPANQQVFASGHKYECSKCRYADSCVESFREHIKSHHTDKNAFQCMECGMCFVVRPSFEKHLFISHRIKDAEAYLQNNDCRDTSAKDEEMDDISEHNESSHPLEDSPPPDLVENQCRVCRKIFESSVQLSKHFRTHGMAFLLTKKCRNNVP